MSRWWYPPVPRAWAAWLRLLAGAFVWVDVLVTNPWVREHGSVPGALHQPLLLGRLLALPTPTEAVVGALVVSLHIVAALFAAGRLPRAAGAALALLYLWWMLVAFSYGKVDHDRYAFLVLLAVLPTAGAARRGDREPSEAVGWALRCTQVAVVATYLLSAVA